jgi:predicted outer membrane repeat protein
MAKRQRRRRDERRKQHAKRHGWTTRQSVVTGAALTAGGLLGVAPSALANNFVVNTGVDTGDQVCQDLTPGDCSLADAIYSSNASTGTTDTITFASNITGVSVTDGQIPITDGVYIRGNGANQTTITSNGNGRIFLADPPYDEPVDIDYVTLTGGDAGNYSGGAVFNYFGDLNFYGSVVTGNRAFDGGGVYDYGGDHGGAYIDIAGTTISGNTATDDGGGIYARGSVGQVKTSTISGNHAGGSSGNVGGGVYMYLGNGSYFDDSTIARNSAFGGGGVYLYYANTAGSYNSIFGENSAAPGFGPDFSGGVYAEGSLFQNTTFTYLGLHPGYAPNITGVDPQLGSLQDNGGSTPTQRLAPTSPAIDQGFSYYSSDQRGVGRPIDIATVANAPGGDASDIGAVELTPGEATIPPAPQPPASVPKKKKCKKKKKKHHAAQTAKKKKCKKKRKKKSAAPIAAKQSGTDDWSKLAFRVRRHDKASDQDNHGAGPTQGTRRQSG